MVEKIIGDYLDSNVFVVSKGNNCVIIDAGASVDKVKNVVGDKKVCGIFLTHGHYDHSLFALDYAKNFDCKIYASEYIKEYLTNPNYNYSDGKFKVEDFSKFSFLKGDGEVQFEDIAVEYIQLGGHSKSDMCFLLDESLFVGDVLIGRDIGRLDLYGGNKADMIDSLRKIYEINYDVMFSGHGEENEKNSQDRTIKLWEKFLSR